MKDKSLNIVLMVLFGAPGIVLLGLSWMLPHLNEERAMALFAAAIGILIAVFSGLKMREPKARRVAVEVEFGKKP
ncbi:MAG: hypothetical protein PHR43_00770 [Dehalococcoidales bacterium]|nr:hypothetical protein [Dehalococcoidales bacterium]